MNNVENQEAPKTDAVDDKTKDQQQASPDVQQEATELDELKAKVAGLRLNLQDMNNKTKPLFVGFSPAMGVSLNPLKGTAKRYLLSQEKVVKKTGVDVIDDKQKDIQSNILNNFYDHTSLDKMKEIIAQSTTVDQLETLKDQIKDGDDPTKNPQQEQVPQSQEENKNIAPVVAATGAGVATGAGIEIALDKTKRERVTTALDNILAEDEKHPIKYKWGSKNDAKGGLDCSGLIYHTIEDAGLKIPAGDSRAFFKQLKTQLVEIDADGKSIKNNLGAMRRGDLVFWNSINPKYKRSTGEIPSIKKDKKAYRIHHIAFVEKVNYADGTISVVESNGSQGVTKSTIDVKEWLTTTKEHQSELYVASMNYNALADAPKKETEKEVEKIAA